MNERRGYETCLNLSVDRYPVLVSTFDQETFSVVSLTSSMK